MKLIEPIAEVVSNIMKLWIHLYQRSMWNWKCPKYFMDIQYAKIVCHLLAAETEAQHVHMNVHQNMEDW